MLIKNNFQNFNLGNNMDGSKQIKYMLICGILYVFEVSNMSAVELMWLIWYESYHMWVILSNDWIGNWMLFHRVIRLPVPLKVILPKFNEPIIFPHSIFGTLIKISVTTNIKRTSICFWIYYFIAFINYIHWNDQDSMDLEMSGPMSCLEPC